MIGARLDLFEPPTPTLFLVDVLTASAHVGCSTMSRLKQLKFDFFYLEILNFDKQAQFCVHVVSILRIDIYFQNHDLNFNRTINMGRRKYDATQSVRRQKEFEQICVFFANFCKFCSKTAFVLTQICVKYANCVFRSAPFSRCHAQHLFTIFNNGVRKAVCLGI